MKRQKGRANGTGEIVPVDKIDWRIIVLQKSSSVRTKTFGKRFSPSYHRKKRGFGRVYGTKSSCFFPFDAI